jgi:hypothetical protein
MAYVILRTEKYKTRDKIAGLVGHHLRIPGSKLDNVDLSRSHLNVVIGAHDRDSFNKAVRSRLATCTRKPRPDANKVVEMLLGASPEFFEGKSYEEQKAYLYDCLDFAKQFFGEANIVGAYMHFDEKSPHISILAVPIETSVRKTKKMEREVTTLNASHFFAGKDAMIQMQTDVALFVQARGHDLLRGEPKSETNREHEPLGSYWKNQAKTIDVAVAAAADHLDDACIKSRVASDLLAGALDEAQRTGVEVEAMAVQRAALDAERTALQELRAAVAAQSRGADHEWTKLREKGATIEKREGELSVRELQAVARLQALDIRYKTAVDDAERTRASLASIREKEAELSKGLMALQERQSDVLRAEEVAELVKRPELLGMLDYLAKNPEARELVALAQVDPAMADVVRSSLKVASGMGSDFNAANWGSVGADVNWQKVMRAPEAVPLPPGFDWSSDGPGGR